MLRNNKYGNDINNWISIFKSKLNSTNSEYMEFYILNKNFLELPQIRGNLNENLLKKNNAKLIEPENKFLILDKKTWLKIKYDYPREKELKVNGSFNNKKCVLKIDPYLYYFYYLIQFTKYYFLKLFFSKYNLRRLIIIILEKDIWNL